MEGLNEKSRALQMRTGMHSLVKSYIGFYNEVNETNLSHLVLMIDDIDMTVSHIPEMLEQLRKYLDLDNLLILMSANLGQLYNEMHEHYSKAFKETLNDRNRALSVDVEDLASKYLLKLFPTSRRIRVEHGVSQMISSDLEVKNEKGSVISSGKLQNVILSLIWQKTRLLFVPKDADTMLHPIIPTNLREMMQFLDMLTSLKEVKYKDKNGNKDPRLFWDIDAFKHCEENVEKFKKYILHNWIPNRLSVEEEMVFDNIPTDITEINKHLINAINMIGTRHKTDLMSREVALDMIERNAEDVNIDRDIYTMVSPNDPKFVKANKISDIFNQPSNYSYGDLLLMIDKYETYFESENDRKFTDAIKIYYSILLFETMFFKSTNVNYDKPKNSIDLNDLLIPIQKLIGGTVYYPNYFEIITDKYFNQKGPSFDAKRAFYHKLPVKKDKVGDGYPFYAVLYYGDIRPDRYDTKHIYDTTFNQNADIDGTKYVTFDMLSILSNMLNPWHTHKRADGNVLNDNTRWKNINDWKNRCIIKPSPSNNEQKFTPNSILPFYSVDIMLCYLKQSLGTVDVVDNYNSVTIPNIQKIVELRDKHYKTFFEIDSKIELDDFVKELSNTFELWTNSINELGGSQYDKDGQLFYNLLKSENSQDPPLKSNSLNNFLSVIEKNEIIINNTIKQLFEIINNLAIIQEIHKCYKTHSVCPPKSGAWEIPELFMNHAIAILMSYFHGSKKELNTLTKDLQKYHSVSEIYKHIVDVLWIDSINEKLIHSQIQEKVRDNTAVARYYNVLWTKTVRQLMVIVPYDEIGDIKDKGEKRTIEESFEKIVEEIGDTKKGLKKRISEIKSISIYCDLFEEARKIFIQK